MPRVAKSQWEFGELFPQPAAPVAPQPLTVAELTSQVRRLLEDKIGQVSVVGEVTNLRAQSSGHLYFTLKDAAAQLNCVLFRGEAPEGRALLQDGRAVVLRGSLTVYEPRGQYQLRVTHVELQGVGALQLAFERLKQKLSAEGLFAQERKRAIPDYPQRIGLVTSPTGAAIHDVLHVVRRRNPGLEIVLAPCRVQGSGAGDEVATAIRLLNGWNAGQETPLDLILVTRGGGSLEDLWAFNEEAVARAIFESRLPVISAVGHEIDFTISDFVADLRAATPSAAAEIITEGIYSSLEFVATAGERLRESWQRQMEYKANELKRVSLRLVREHPRRKFNEWLQRLDDLQTGLGRCARSGVRERRVAWENLRDRLLRLRPRQILSQRQELLRERERRLADETRRRLEQLKGRFQTLEARLRLLGPEQVLARGYSITMDAESGKVIRNADEVKEGRELKTRLKTGEVRSRVLK